jgi:hypothetical protein
MRRTKQIKTTNGKETNMERRGFTHCVCFVLMVAALLLAARAINAQSLEPADPGLTLCSGPYALCAAATCTLTGATFPETSFPEVVCECPVLPGPALADVTGGNMQGNCDPPADGVWSLFWPNLKIPQEIKGFWRKNVRALPHNCPSTIGQPPQPVLFGQCFSYSCKNVRKINGVLVADCYCPAQHIIDPNKDEFAVQAGQCQASICTQIPVGAPFVAPGNFCQ